ncbi:unnamed protein product [Ceutorhynchus assimilis]|uniref:Uncharacterized protein n=1 Tax=Ceutorhynchus assimilis TaxID=467358 RepID=A0A9N9MIC9_9CUCU|nr:unnamed protein product [Ceutorhynchus assimilis]
MTSLKCETCSKSCIFKSRPKEDEIFGSPCDLCQRPICKLCAEITTTEAHAVSLARRSLLFFCPDCKLSLNDHMKDLPNYRILLEKYEKTKKESAIKDKSLETLENKCSEITQELRIEINKLITDNEAKAIHIKRLNRKTQDFENSAIDAEQELYTEINNQKAEILQLAQNISDLIDTNLDLTAQLSCRFNRDQQEYVN